MIIGTPYDKGFLVSREGAVVFWESKKRERYQINSLVHESSPEESMRKFLIKQC